MGRPALSRLLADIDARRIDVIVVYKVDRLTRALADFAKIVDRLNAANASFVSVTQAFNTTSSMGRLTLNVLLSFAQFEREVTGERIRDKLAASKAKGMWMGGSVPLGYDRPTDLTTRALVVNELEAEQVRLMFRRYLELGSVSLLRTWLDTAGLRSKAYVSTSGRAVGGVSFNRGALFHLLRNRVYVGEIVHKGKHHPGAHSPIIDRELFDAVQAGLTANTRQHVERPTRVSTMPLRGRIFDAEGQPMSPTFGHGNKGQVYRYYVSAPLQQGQRRSPGDDAILRVPAAAIEELVLERIRPLIKSGSLGSSWPTVFETVQRIEVHPASVHLCLNRARMFGVHADHDAELARLQKRLMAGDRAIVDTTADNQLRLIVPIRLKLRGGRTWVTSPNGTPAIDRARPDPVLIKALRSAHKIAARAGLAGTTSEASIRDGQSLGTRYERRLCTLAFLAPDIQSAIIEGHQPPGLNLQRLFRGEIPLDWAAQRTGLGFPVI
jgi:site-specific DNA recombinase